jgi:hypothetical protein
MELSQEEKQESRRILKKYTAYNGRFEAFPYTTMVARVLGGKGIK